MQEVNNAESQRATGRAPEAVIYARQSFDRHGDSLAVERQLTLCREYAAEHGWRVVREYVDNDVSATTGVRRPEFERLLASSPPRIVVWHTDRLVRLTSDLEKVIALGVDVFAVKAGHLDLSNPAGRAVARTITAWATYEGEQKVERQRASNLARARRGEPPKGRRAFGYSTDGWNVIEGEAAVMRQAANDVLSGRSLQAICRELREGGVLTPAGNAWRHGELKQALMNPRYAALAVHRGEIVGQAKWPAILDEDTHRALVSILTDPSRKATPLGPPRRYLLSGLVTCSLCGSTLKGKHFHNKNTTKMVCSNTPHLSTHAGRLEEHVIAAVLAVLRDRAEYPWLFAEAPTDDGPTAHDLAEEAQRIRTKLDEAAAMFAADTIDAQQFAQASERLRERLADIDMQRASMSHARVADDLLDAPDIEAVWHTLPLDKRRAIISDICSIQASPPGRGAKKFNPDTVTFTWHVPAPVRVRCAHRPAGVLIVEEVADDGTSRGWAPLTMRVDRVHKTVTWSEGDDDVPCALCPQPDDATLTHARATGVLVIDV